MILEIMKLKCENCGDITYRELNDGLISSDCLKCRGSLTIKPTGEVSTAEFDMF